jgi:hypothetical protein
VSFAIGLTQKTYTRDNMPRDAKRRGDNPRDPVTSATVSAVSVLLDIVAN